MSFEKRNTLPFKVRLPEVEGLKALNGELTALSRVSFTGRYGNILDLLSINVQADAIQTLAQFYDPPTRSFLFRDFQLAPTLEEFGSILGTPSKHEGPYVEIGSLPEIKELAEALGIDAQNLEENMKGRRDNVKGFIFAYLEEKAWERSTHENKEPFINILALLVYGLVLFPSFENFIDTAAVSVFWAVFKKGRNPVPALLADVYYGLHMLHLRGKGSIILCFPLLYRWFTDLLPDNLQWKQMEKGGWPPLLASITSDSISWKPARISEEVIISCGGFPNVPLIGPRACINYNPVLALRQLGRPLWDQPEDHILKSLVLHDKGIHNLELVQDIIQAWGSVHRLKGFLKRKNHQETYSLWIKERVKKVKIPFLNRAAQIPTPPAPLPISVEEVETLKSTIAQLKKENEELEGDLIQIIQQKNDLRKDREDQDRDIKSVSNRLKFEQERRLRVAKALEAAELECENRRRDIKELMGRNEELHKLWEKAYTEESRLRDTLEARTQEFHERLEAERQEFRTERKGFQEALDSEEQKRLELKEEYENFLSYERDISERNFSELQSELDQERKRIEDLESTVDFFRTHGEEFRQAANEEARRFKNLVKYIQEGEPYQMLCDERDYWKRRSDRFAAIARGMIDEILIKLGAANEAMMPQETPDDVQKFLDCCNNLVRELKRRIRGR